VNSSNLRWFHVFLVRDLWGVMVIHSTLWLVKASVQDWGQLYLVQGKGFDKGSTGECTVIAPCRA
jgi:sugar phosphate permease